MPRRRTILAGAGSGALVIGFNLMSGTWATAAEGTSASLDRVPPLDGTLHLDRPTREQDSRDAGRYVVRLPRAVLRPGSVEDIQKMVRFCRRRGIPVAARGLANTTNGQGLVTGLLIENRSLAEIHSIEPDRAVVGAGTTWLELTKAAYEHGLTPPSLTGYIGLTMGGTLSLGGIPPAYQAGGQVDSVLELEVVTGTGELVRCSATSNRELFEAVLAGLGQYGILTKAVVELVPAKQKVRGHSLSYTDAKAFFADLRTLVGRGEITEIYGEWWRPGEHGEVHHLEAFTFYDPDNPPDDAYLLRGLTVPADQAEITDNDYLPHITRIDAAVEELKETIDWGNLMKPWFTCWLPESRIEQYIDEVVPALTPRDVGTGGFVLIYVHQRSQLTRPSLRLSEDDGSDWVYLFTLMTAGPHDAGPEFATEMLARNRRLYDRAHELGGARYPIESVDFTVADWEAHYGDRWAHLRALKERFDPERILTPGPGVFE